VHLVENSDTVRRGKLRGLLQHGQRPADTNPLTTQLRDHTRECCERVVVRAIEFAAVGAFEERQPISLQPGSNRVTFLWRGLWIELRSAQIHCLVAVATGKVKKLTNWYHRLVARFHQPSRK